MADAIVAQLPALDAPSPKAQRLAAGLALVRQGMDYRSAAERVGVPKTTLWNHCHGLDSGVGRNEAMVAIEAQIEDLSAQIVVRAAEKILTRLDDDSMRPSEEIKAMQVARDTLAIRRDWNKASVGDARAVNALADALESMRDKVQADSKLSQAIDVTIGDEP